VCVQRSRCAPDGRPDTPRTRKEDLAHMNSRARNRLIGVTVIILLVAVALLVTIGASGGASDSTVKQVVGNASMVGKRVMVSGTVVDNSWDKKTNPMTFYVRDIGVTSGPELKVIYDGTAPSTFGNGSEALLTGSIEKGGVIDANQMVVKCPSTYAEKTGAETVTQALKATADVPIRVAGYLKPGSLKDASATDRFILASTATGGDQMPVVFGGAMPQGSVDGVGLVVFGKVHGGVLTATSVALSK
jgi:cytochrome c-type biogenesis protein CcmE